MQLGPQLLLKNRATVEVQQSITNVLLLHSCMSAEGIIPGKIVLQRLLIEVLRGLQPAADGGIVEGSVGCRAPSRPVPRRVQEPQWGEGGLRSCGPGCACGTWLDYRWEWELARREAATQAKWRLCKVWRSVATEPMNPVHWEQCWAGLRSAAGILLTLGLSPGPWDELLLRERCTDEMTEAGLATMLQLKKRYSLRRANGTSEIWI